MTHEVSPGLSCKRWGKVKSHLNSGTG